MSPKPNDPFGVGRKDLDIFSDMQTPAEELHEALTNASAPDVKINTDGYEIDAKDLEHINDPAIISELVSLIKNTEIEKFNKIRPQGRLDFRGQNFSGLHLSGIDLRYVDLTRAVLSRCTLSEAKMQHSQCDRAEMDYLTIDGTKFYKTTFNGTNIAYIQSAVESQWHEAVVEFANMVEGCFDGAFFDDAFIIDSSINGSTWRKASLKGAEPSQNLGHETPTYYLT